MIYSILHILFAFIYIYLAINILYLFIIAVAGHFRKKTNYSADPQKKRIAVLITSYREDSVIINTMQQATTHNYPEALYKVFLATDHLQKETVFRLKNFIATVVELNH